jgi:hypothetical protein
VVGGLALAQAADPVALEVRMAVFSGLPDPAFSLTDAATIREIMGRVEAAPRHPTVLEPEAFVRPMFGYRGFFITPVGAAAGFSVMEVFGTTIELLSPAGAGGALVPSFRHDANAELEQFLFQLARARGIHPVETTPAGTAPAVGVGVRVTERSLTLELGAVVQTAAPLPLRAPITVPPGTRVRMIAAQAGEAEPVRWVKDSREITGSGRTLEFTTGGPGDSGRYWAVVGHPDGPSVSSDAAMLFVSARAGQRLVNVSLLGRVTRPHPELTAGFVVEPAGQGMNTLLLVRAVGPALGIFGVSDGVSAPALQITDARGAIVPQANLPFVLPTLAAATQRAGAFALPAEGRDVARLYWLPAGSFTAHATATEGGEGAILIEIFEVPLN